MDRRNYYIHLKAEDFKFVKAETKVTFNCSRKEINIPDRKLKRIQEEILWDVEAEEEEEEEESRELREDYNEKKNKQAYKPLSIEIEEWRQAVEVLSSRAVKCTGRLFGNLEPVPLIDGLDPAPGSCFNCWQAGHPSRECPEPRTAFCVNCGRRGESVANCPRCYRQQLAFFATRRDEARRRETNASREFAGTWRERLEDEGISKSVGRAVNDRRVPKASDAPESTSRSRKAEEKPEENNGARYRRISQGRPDARAENPKGVYVSDGFEGGLPRRETSSTRLEGPKEYRGCHGGKDAGEEVATGKPRRRRLRRRRRSRRRRERQEGVAQTEDRERRRNNQAREPKVSAETKSRAARRETATNTVVEESRQEVAEAGTESRRIEGRQQTEEEEDYEVQERQGAFHWAVATRRSCENKIVSNFKRDDRVDSTIESKKQSEEQKLPMTVLKMTRSQIDQLLVVLKEIQQHDIRNQGLDYFEQTVLY